MKRRTYSSKTASWEELSKKFFPDAKRSQRRVNRKKTWHYTLSCASSDSSDSVEWENLPNETSSEALFLTAGLW